MNKTIKYYTSSNIGSWNQSTHTWHGREVIHPDNQADGSLIEQLTGKPTIDSRIRELISDLTGGAISFVQVIAP